MERITYKMPKS